MHAHTQAYQSVVSGEETPTWGRTGAGLDQCKCSCFHGYCLSPSTGFGTLVSISESDTERKRETERDRERHRETQRDTERQRETEKHRERVSKLGTV